MTSKVLVTGGSGFIGNALIRHLLENDVHVIATSTNINNDLLKHSQLTWLEWSYTKSTELSIDWNSIDTIVHAAAPRQLFDFPNNAQPIYDVLLDATHYLLKQAVHHNINNFNLISTGDVIGHPEAQNESSQYYNPHSFYGAVKASAELITKSYSPLVKTKILRIFHPYGPNGNRFLVNRLVKKVRENESITIEGDNGIILNPIWIDDLVQGIYNTITNPFSGTFHMGGMEPLSLRGLIDQIAEKLSITAKIEASGQAIPFSHSGICNTTYKTLNWYPKIKIAHGLDLLINDKTEITR